jgi:ABC-2 type transport system permease protein
MKAILGIARREWSAYFASPIGWIALCGFAVICGFFFSLMLLMYASQAQQAMAPYQLEQMNVNDWILVPLLQNLSVICLLVFPALTMGLYAADRQQRSIELLLTSPVSSAQIVLGKFLGAMGFAAVLVAVTLQVPLVLDWLGNPDRGVILSNYLGFILLLGAFVAVGGFASSLTENQLVALVLAFAANMMTWVVGWLGDAVKNESVKTVVEYVSIVNHMEDMGKGVVHLGDAVYFLSIIVFFLFCTVQRVEALRWR